MDCQDYTDKIIDESLKSWVPAPDLMLSEWADAKFYLSPESAAEPGKWTTYPYQRGPMDAITEIRNERVTWKKSARVGYTKMINCAIGYHIEHDPCPMLVVQPTIEDGKGYSRDEIEPMIRDNPSINPLVADAKSRDSGNTIMKKSFPGGILNIIGANSARGFRRLTVRKVFFDEVDGYPPTAGQEGDQIALGMKRSETFWNRQAIIGSTPTVKGLSRVSDIFEESDRRFYFVPCPHCGHFQTLEWERIKFPDKNNLERIYYECELCRKPIDHRKKRTMIEQGEWRATRDFNGHAGFLLWSAYSFSPGAAWSQIAKRFLDANQHFKDTGDNSKLRTWTNTDKGEEWEERGKGIDSIELLSGNKTPIEEGVAPDGVLVITSGWDIQDDRIEGEILGWGTGDETWSLDYVILYGDTEREDVWNQLHEQIFKRVFVRSGITRMRIACTCVDHGDHSHMVETFVKPRQGRRVFACKGRSTYGGSLVGKPSKKSILKGVMLFPTGSDVAKEIIMSRLAIEKPGPGYCHFPDHYEDEYFRQLTAEEKFTEYVNGAKRYVWRLKKGVRRNEALDCRGLNLYAKTILNPRFDVIRKRLASKEDAEIKKQVEYETGETVEQDTDAHDKPKKNTMKRERPAKSRRRGFVRRY